MSDQNSSVGNCGATHRFLAQRELAAQALINGATIADAMRAAGYAESTVDKQNPETVGPIRALALAAMERRGLTVDVAAERLHTRMFSIKPVNVYTADGKTQETILAEDSGAQLEALKIFGKWMGLEAPAHVRLEGSMMHTMSERRAEQCGLWDKLAVDAEVVVTDMPGDSNGNGNGNGTGLH